MYLNLHGSQCLLLPVIPVSDDCVYPVCKVLYSHVHPWVTRVTTAEVPGSYPHLKPLSILLTHQRPT